MEMITKLDGSSIVSVQIKKDNGEITKKSISFVQYRELLEGSKEFDSNMIQIGRLPKGYYDGSISAYEKETFTCKLIIPECVFPASYYEEVYLIPYPALFFYFKVSRGHITLSKCYALRDNECNEDTPLFQFPYANVYEDGKICWGTNKIPELEEMSGLDEIVGMFYGTPYNEDLFRKPVKAIDGIIPSTLRAFFMKLNRKGNFPCELLKPCGKTIKEL